jgi:hypothetical protein
MAEEWGYAQDGGGRSGSSRSVKAPVPEVVAYPAPGPVNQAAMSELLREQNRHAVQMDEVDRRNLRAARRARRRGDDGGLEDSVWRGEHDGIREPEAARPPPQYDDEDRTDSDEYDDHYDAHAGEEYERGRADAAERERREEQRRMERRKAKRRGKQSHPSDRRRGGGRHRRGTRVKQVPEDAEFESDDSTRQIHSRDGSFESGSDGMSVQSFSTVGSRRSNRSSRSHRSSREPKGILRAPRDRDDRWERGSSHSHRSHRSHRSKAGSSRRGGSRSRSQHDERAMRDDVRREVRARAREQDVERRRFGEPDEDVWKSSRSDRSSKPKHKDRDRGRDSDRRGSRAGSSRAKSSRGGRSSSTSTTPAAWGDHKTATMVHFELPCSCRVGAFYVIGLLVMIGLLVVGVVMVARALLEAEDGIVPAD